MLVALVSVVCGKCHFFLCALLLAVIDGGLPCTAQQRGVCQRNPVSP